MTRCNLCVFERMQRPNELYAACWIDEEDDEAAPPGTGYFCRQRPGVEGERCDRFDARVGNVLCHAFLGLPAALHGFREAAQIAAQNVLLHLCGFELKRVHGVDGLLIAELYVLSLGSEGRRVGKEGRA